MTQSPSSMSEPAKAQSRFQQALFETFSQSKIKNPQYSLRSFAKRLDISAAALSEIMAGKRRVSAKLAQRMLERLNLSPADLEPLVAGLARSHQGLSKRQSKSGRVTILSNDQFKIVTEWYHFGILTLLETKDASTDVGFLSGRLGVSKRDITAAIERLERLGMLGRDHFGKLQLTGESFHSSDGVPSSAVRASHSQALDLAKASLETDDVTIRDFTSLTFAASPSDLPKARKLIRKFRTDLANALGRDPKEEVYMLSINLFPLSKADSKRSKGESRT